MSKLIIYIILAVLLMGSTPGGGGEGLPDVGLASGVECFNCVPFNVRIRLTHYDPMKGPINCFDYHDNYCWSTMSSGLPWKSFFGLAAACPQGWPMGAWVDIEKVGRFICLDHGGMVVCSDYVPDDRYEVFGLSDYLPEILPETICAVDIMGRGGEWWDGQYFDITLWVPFNPR